jgi:general secretion pathway protein C
MASRLLAFVVWGIAAASAVYWALLFGARPLAAPSFTLAVPVTTAAVQADLGRVLGREAPSAAADAPAVPTSSRFQLLGVVAPKGEGREGGWALIATEGRPAKAYRQGAVLEGEVVVQSIQHRQVQLGPVGQPPQFNLELPLLPAAARGTPAPMGGMPSTAMPTPAPPNGGRTVRPLENAPPVPQQQGMPGNPGAELSNPSMPGMQPPNGAVPTR